MKNVFEGSKSFSSESHSCMCGCYCECAGFPFNYSWENQWYGVGWVAWVRP